MAGFNPLNNLKLQYKIMLPVGIIMACLLAAMAGVLVTKSRELLMDDAMRFASTQAGKSALEIKTSFEEALDVARTTSDVFSGMIRSRVPVDREAMNITLKTILEGNHELLGIWAVFEPNALDGKDEEFKNTEGYDSTGRFATYFNRITGTISQTIAQSYTEPGDGDYYLLPLKAGHPMIMPPYEYEVSGKKVAMTCICVPVLMKGKPIGVVGVDMSLADMNEMVGKIRPYETGYAYLSTSEGIVVAHKVESNIGLNIFDLPFFEDISTLKDSVQNGKQYITYYTSPSTNGKVLAIFEPILFDHTDQSWTIVVVIPTEKVMEKSHTILMLAWTMIPITILLVLLTIFLVARSISRPIARSVAFAEQIAAGHLDSTLNVKSKDEIGSLANALNSIPVTLNKVISGTLEMVTRIEHGELMTRSEPSEFPGDYSKVVEGINLISDSFVDHLNQFPAPAIIVDKEMNLLFINSAARRITGKKVEELLGSRCHDELNSSHCNTRHCVVQRAFTSGKPCTDEMILTVGDEKYEIKYSGIPVRNKKGEVVAALEFLVDQTEIKVQQRRSEKVAEYLGQEVELLSHTMENVAQGNLDTSYEVSEADSDTAQVHDMFVGIQTSVNSTIATLAANMEKTRKIAEYSAAEVESLSDAMNRVAAGDLTSTYEPAESDEDTEDTRQAFAGIATAINASTINLASIMRDIQNNSASLNDSSQELDTISSGLLSATEQMSVQAGNVAGATEEMSATINSMASVAEETSTNVSSVSATTEQMSGNMHSVAGAVEEMSASIKEINKHAENGSRIAGNAMDMANNAGETMNLLGQAAQEIDKVTEVIKRIAEQTNLLALNATIEAASAGEAGKGFAVVAGEIKELANQSAKAAEEIAEKIGGMQKNAGKAVTVMGEISEIISTINDSVSSISRAMGEQDKAASEISARVDETNVGATNIAQSISEISQGTVIMSQNASEAAKASNEVASNIQGVGEAVSETNENAKLVSDASKSLSEMANDMNNLVSGFKV